MTYHTTLVLFFGTIFEWSFPHPPSSPAQIECPFFMYDKIEMKCLVKFTCTMTLSLFKVVTKLTPCHGELFGLNSFGVGGANAHVLLSPQKKVKKLSNSTTGDQLPRIVTVSGRTEEAVNVIVNEVYLLYVQYADIGTSENKITLSLYYYNIFVSWKKITPTSNTFDLCTKFSAKISAVTFTEAMSF